MIPAPIHVHGRMPFADGICYDDRHGMEPHTVRLLRARGLVWLTQLRIDNEGEEYRYLAGAVIAGDLARAEEIASLRGLGEVVIGRWEGP
ncbi:Uncharacterised protein [Starkeya nomas]|uniref:Uncharacterized protein n=1 Tax=Starkeya nomas TaxID=2666134 RepID=A0A5S9R770_9HYPH|nr:hypothetical protein [Starkeya nomas]CAA0130177.1 Uncharacterised protein [Starkeya nomas]